jgi:hypothetical protein
LQQSSRLQAQHAQQQRHMTLHCALLLPMPAVRGCAL